MAIEILIVDDNADIRNILNEMIIDAGYQTRLAANYNQAISEIDKKIPDVAILDVKLDNRKTKSLNPGNKKNDQNRKIDLVQAHNKNKNIRTFTLFPTLLIVDNFATMSL